MSLTATWGSQMRLSPGEDHCNQEEGQRKRTDPQPSVMVNVFCDLGARRKAANEGGTQKHKRRRYGSHPFLHSSSVFNCLQVYGRSSPRQSPLRLVASELFTASKTWPPFRGQGCLGSEGDQQHRTGRLLEEQFPRGAQVTHGRHSACRSNSGPGWLIGETDASRHGIAPPSKTPSVRKSELGVLRTPAVALLLPIGERYGRETPLRFGRLQSNHALLDGDEKCRRLYLCRRLTTCPVPRQRSLVDIEELRRSFGPPAIEPRHKVFKGLI
jgi:hypothetical protein